MAVCWTTSSRSRQDSSERAHDAPTTLWPAGAVLAHALASDCASWQGKVILELGCGVAAALARALQPASSPRIYPKRRSRSRLKIRTEPSRRTSPKRRLRSRPRTRTVTVVTRLLDWDDDAALAAAVAEHGPFFAVVGAALEPAGRSMILGALDRTVVVLAHAWADDDVEDLLADPWCWPLVRRRRCGARGVRP